jgi:hypothetical protein
VLFVKLVGFFSPFSLISLLREAVSFCLMVPQWWKCQKEIKRESLVFKISVASRVHNTIFRWVHV